MPKLTHNQDWTFPGVRGAQGASELEFWASHPDTAPTLLTSCHEEKLLKGLPGNDCNKQKRKYT